MVFSNSCNDGGPVYLVDHIIVNNSNYALDLLEYGNGEMVTIGCGEEYTDTTFADYGGDWIEPFGYVKDSVEIRFHDGKRIIYEHRFTGTKNIYNSNYHQLTEINTVDKKERYWQYRFYITPEDYLLAE